MARFAAARFVAGRFVAARFVTGRFVTARFVAGRFVAGRFVAARFVAGRFVAGRFVAGFVPAAFCFFAAFMLSTRLGYGLPARRARARAAVLDFAVSFVCVRFGFLRFQGGVVAMRCPVALRAPRSPARSRSRADHPWLVALDRFEPRRALATRSSATLEACDGKGAGCWQSPR